MTQLSFAFGVAAFAGYDKDGFAEIQVDALGASGQAGTQPAECIMPLGFYALPLDPDRTSGSSIGLGASLLVVHDGGRRSILPLGDPRDRAKVPRVRPGGAMMAGGAGEFRSYLIIDGFDRSGIAKPGSITMGASYSKGGAQKSHGLSFNVRTPGEEEITIVSGEGQRFQMSAKGARPVVMMNAKGSAWFETNDDGNVISGNITLNGSLAVGSAEAAMAVAIWPKLLGYLEIIEAALVKGNAGGPIMPAPILKTLAKEIGAQHLKTT